MLLTLTPVATGGRLLCARPFRREPMSSKTRPRTANETMPRQFRLGDEALADLDEIAAWLAETTCQPSNRTAAIRYAARQIVAGLRKKKKSS